MRNHTYISRLSIGFLGLSSFISCTNGIQPTGMDERERAAKPSFTLLKDKKTKKNRGAECVKWSFASIGLAALGASAVPGVYTAISASPNSTNPWRGYYGVSSVLPMTREKTYLVEKLDNVSEYLNDTNIDRINSRITREASSQYFFDDIDKRDNNGNTALMLVIINRADEDNSSRLKIKYLLDGDADINIQNNDGDTTLILAAKSYGYHSTVKELLDGGADVNIQNKNGNNALMEAASTGNTEIVKMLLETKKILYNLQNNDGNTALILAASDASSEVVKLLLANGADVNLRNNDGDTALILAALQWRSSTFFKTLLDSGADVNLRNNDGDTVLMEAASKGSSELVKLLLANGADVNLRNNNGDTALIVALQGYRSSPPLRSGNLDTNDRIGTVRALLSSGKIDTHNLTKACELARSKGFDNIVQVLTDQMN